MIDLNDVQGLVFAGWGKAFPFAAFSFIRLGDPAGARAWLDELRADVSWAGEIPHADHRLQVALSMKGLTALGVPAEVVARFPQEAQINMHGRSRTLGDEGDNAPAKWSLWPDETAIHGLVMIYAKSDDDRTRLTNAHADRLRAHGGDVVITEKAWEWGKAEPFGFADGLSQPYVRGAPQREGVARAPDDEIPTGEVLLGYQNAYGFEPQSPVWGTFDLGKNGSYLVFRKLQQHVDRFWKYFRERAIDLEGQSPVPAGVEAATDWLAARAMGRWRNGTSLAKFPDEPGPELPLDKINAFQYLADDPDGQRCPIGAHVRRANPRDARGGTRDESLQVVNRHRILRRGRAFGRPLDREQALKGDDDGEARGLLFISLQASIARGFEFIQQTWNANPGFHGLVDESDPVTGGGARAFTIPAAPVRLRLADLPQFVTTLGGGYLFLPSRAALGKIVAR